MPNPTIIEIAFFVILIIALDHLLNWLLRKSNEDKDDDENKNFLFIAWVVFGVILFLFKMIVEYSKLLK